METSCRARMKLLIFGLYLCVAALSFTHCNARRSLQLSRSPRNPRSSIIKSTKKLEVSKHLDMDTQLYSSNTGPYGVNSPFSLPPYDSLAPIPLPENAPPFCVYPPFTPQPPSTTIPFPPPIGGYTPSLPPPSSSSPPILPGQSPPPSPSGIVPSPPESMPSPNLPPEIVPSPTAPTVNVPSPPESIPSPNLPPEILPSPPSPTSNVPSPTGPVLSPPSYYEPSPPSYVPNPPLNVPSPSIFVPSPPVFQPPVVYPPPTVPPSPKTAPNSALWCVAKPTVPDPIVQEAMNYACGSGADCDSILPNGSCFQPNTLFAHASYAFNSYWQRTKVAGGTCEFGGTAMLVTVDPSFDGCHFVYY